MPAKRSQLGRLVLLGLLVIVLAGIWWQRLAVSDWLRLLRYDPPVAITELVRSTTMTSYSERIFYVNHPQLLEERSEFDKHCTPKEQEQTIVLGCYYGGQGGIYIFNVEDPELAGVEEVTAAHEMLHAAYDRLSASQKAEVNGWLEAFYATELQDGRLLKLIDSYKKTEPHDVPNEMHSIFATEVAVLPDHLEKYYSQYFVNRKAVAQFAAQYQQAFTSREEQVKEYDRQLTSLKQEITEQEAILQAQQDDLRDELRALQQERSEGNAQSYNARVNQYNARVAVYNALLAEVKQKVTQYNELVVVRNALALEAQRLHGELKGTADPLPAQ